MPPRGQQAAGGRGRGAAAATRAAAAAAADPPYLARFRGAVPAMDAAAAQLLGLPAAGPRPGDQQWRELPDVMGDLAALPRADAIRVLSDPAVASLLKLAAAAAHWLPGGTPEPALQKVALHAVNTLSRLCISAADAPEALRVCRTLLRMRVLHAFARQMAAAAAAVRAGRPLPSAAGSAGTMLWRIWTSLVGALVACAVQDTEQLATGRTVDGSAAPAAAAAAAAGRAALCGELAAALRSSCVLEHAAQGLVLLAGRPDCAGARGGSLGPLLEGLQLCILTGSSTCSRRPSQPTDPTPAEQLAAALRPPCVQHLLAAGGVLALREADGGPVYGLDTELYGRLFAGGDAKRSWHLLWLLSLHAAERCGPPFLLRRGPWCSMLLRMAAAGIECRSQAAAAAAAHPLLDVALDVSHHSLYAMASLLGHPALSQQQREEAWLLLLRLCEVEVAASERAGVVRLTAPHAEVIRRFTGSLDEPKPAGPASVAAALSAGLLPYLERTARHAARTTLTTSLRPQLAVGLMRGGPRVALLTHGSVQQVAALAVTLRKVLQRADAARLGTPWHLEGMFPWGACENVCVQLAQLNIVATEAASCAPKRGAKAAAGAAAEGAAAAGAEAAGAEAAGAGAAGAAAAGAAAAAGDGAQQGVGAPPPAGFWPQLTLVLAELLPALAGALVRAEAAVPRLVAGAGEGDVVCANALHVLGSGYGVACVWCTDLAYLAASASQHPGDSGAEGREDGGAPGGAGAGWQEILLRRVRVVELVGAGLRFCAQTLGSSSCPAVLLKQEPVLLSSLIKAAVVVARTFPQQVREAVHPPGGGGAGGSADSAGARAAGGGGGGAAWPVAELLPLARAHAGADSYRRAVTLSVLLHRWSQGAAAEPSRPHDEDPPAPLRLAPLAEARALLRTCSNPACANLGGDSEADVALQVCAGCGTTRYCCCACQAAHWRAGHQEECGQMGRQGA